MRLKTKDRPVQRQRFRRVPLAYGEVIYLNLADDGHHFYQQLQAYFSHYLQLSQLHQALGGQTPATIYTQTSTIIYC